jgi:hypothetical protein
VRTPLCKRSFDLGARIIVRHAARKSFRDVSPARLLHKYIAFDLCLGAAFNTVNARKSRHLAAGFDLMP